MIEIFILFFVFAYGFLMLYFILGNLKKSAVILNQKKYAVSIIIPFRNEEKKLKNLIQSLKSQNYEVDLLEIIFVNDSSEDTGTQIIETEMGDWDYRLLNLKGENGKKIALKTGILAAQNELILTTDADTTRGPNWVSQMIQYYNAEKTKLVVGPVFYSSGRNFGEKLQALEFAELIATTQGAIAQNNAYLCNGANLLFSKEAYFNLKEETLKPKISSGDDIFLLHALKKKSKEATNIVFASAADAIVYTEASDTFKSFIQQRMRWAGKSILYADFFSIWVGILVFLTNMGLLAAFIYVLKGRLSGEVFLFSFLFKWIIDLTLISSIKSWSKFNVNIFHTFLLSLIYPFYIISVAFLSLLFKPDWKGRKIK